MLLAFFAIAMAAPADPIETDSPATSITHPVNEENDLETAQTIFLLKKIFFFG